jgi:hypothetical protein
MRNLLLSAGAVILLNLPLAALADQRPLTVVELFQSQGCSDCPPANANVMALSGLPDLLTLSFGVTYWGYLGWKDTFASPQFTARQWDYAHALHHAEVYTPQVIVNGRADIVGNDRAALEHLIAREANASGPMLQLSDGVLHLGTTVSGAYQVWLARFDPRIENVAITRGENGGLTLPHKNVVKQLAKIGDWDGRATSLPVPPTPNGLAQAVLIQAGAGGPIVGAARD